MNRVAFVGQAMPRSKKGPHDWPSLNNWLFSIGISIKHIRNNFYYTALVDYFPGSKNGSHKIPSVDEIHKEKGRLKRQLFSFKPDVVVPVGKLSISYCLGKRIDTLSDIVGQRLSVDPYDIFSRRMVVIPLPHPSGASTWRHKSQNVKLLSTALSILKMSILE